jgi:hypothetical protein
VAVTSNRIIDEAQLESRGPQQRPLAATCLFLVSDHDSYIASFPLFRSHFFAHRNFSEKNRSVAQPLDTFAVSPDFSFRTSFLNE